MTQLHKNDETYFETPEEEIEYLMGDLNGDGNLDVNDIIMLNGISRGLIEPTPYQLIVGDLDGDGAITSEDYFLLVALMFG